MENLEGLSDNYPPSKNINIHINSVRTALRSKIESNGSSRDQIKRMSLEKDIENRVEKSNNYGTAIMSKRVKIKREEKIIKRRLVISNSRIHCLTQWIRYLLMGWSPIRIFDPEGDAYRFKDSWPFYPSTS
ncbi:hypothetical protein C2G38_2173072 [Gigaspora rosea]|uniref:Uncharacterized protein n=1 Tax=Gigaspora rosea TaxID=44941 RepID=A0A397VJX7_9GLOM|nr:hypothetical protein C2G38_2173072 [Gigaspora rosea]